jgi:hypothetical protein
MVHSRGREFESLSRTVRKQYSLQNVHPRLLLGQKPEQNILLEIQSTGVMLMQRGDGTAL